MVDTPGAVDLLIFYGPRSASPVAIHPILPAAQISTAGPVRSTQYARTDVQHCDGFNSAFLPIPQYRVTWSDSAINTNRADQGVAGDTAW